MINKDSTLIGFISGGWLATFWDGYLEPWLQGTLLVATVVGAVIIVISRYLELRMKYREYKKDGN